MVFHDPGCTHSAVDLSRAGRGLEKDAQRDSSLSRKQRVFMLRGKPPFMTTALKIGTKSFVFPETMKMGRATVKTRLLGGPKGHGRLRSE